MLKPLIRMVFLVALIVLSALPAWSQAQGSSADLTGVIFDSSKAVISDATVTVVNLQTTLTRTTTSDGNGAYRVTLLPPGEYEIKVKASGFNLQVKRGIILTVGQTAVVNFDLLIGVKMETEVIETAMALIEPERTGQSSTITQKQINNLPINGRNFMDFARLTPGVVEESPTVTNGQVPQLQTSGLSFTGQNGRANTAQIDGVNNNDIASNGVRPTLSQEAIREFQVNRNGYNAEFGRASGGVINIVSKSGSNEFHGNFFDYFRNERLDARNTFATSFQKDPPFKRNQPGFTLGGPIRRDKTFFFFASEALLRRESAITSILSDPSILNPTAGQQDLINTLLTSNDPMVVQQALNIQQLLTTSATSMNNLTTTGPGIFQQNLSTFNFLNASHGIFPIRETSTTSSLRVDEVISEQDYLFFRYNFTNDAPHGVGVGGLFGPSAGYDIASIDNAAVVGENHVFKNGSTNELRFEFARNTFNAHTVDPFGPRYSLAGIGFLGREFTAPSDRRQYRYQFIDNFSVKRGRNNIKFGGDFSHYNFKTSTPIFGGGNLEFAPTVPLAAVLGPAAAQLVNALNGPLNRPDLAAMVLNQPLTTVQHLNLGLPRTVNQGFGNPNASISGNILGLYAQNGRQVKSNLFMSFGLRYDYDLQPPGVPRDRNNFGPRIGFAYDPFKNGKTVIRGGGGLYYQSLYTATTFISQVLGQGRITNIFVSPDPNLTPIDPNSSCGQMAAAQASPTSGFPAFCFYQQLVSSGLVSFASTGTILQSAYQNLLGLTTTNNNNRVVVRLHNGAVNPYSLQGSLGIDHEFARNLFVSVNYLVNHGVKLGRSRQSNALPNPGMLDAFGRPALTARLDPTRLADFVYETAGNSIYHGLTASINKRFNRSVQLIAAYTYSKAIDDVTDLNIELGPQDPTNARDDRGPSSFNVGHRLSVSSLIDSPFRGGGGQPFYQRVLANFYVSPIITARSGFAFNVLTGIDVNMDNNNNDRPFAFGRNTGIGPSFFTTDLRVGRRFPLGSDSARSIEAIIDTFNLFNRVNFRDVNNNTGGVLYLDQIGITDTRLTGCQNKPSNTLCGFTSAYDPRILQLAVKVSF